jgi:hypothetical protein
MPDLDQIKQGEQGRATGGSVFPRAGRAQLRGRRDHVNRDEGGNGMRLAADSLQITARPAGGGGGRNGLDRQASQELRQISINLALSLRGEPCATKRSRPFERAAARDCFPTAKPAGRNDDRSE